MPTVNVTFRNPVTGDERRDSAVGDDYTVAEVIDSLQQQQFIRPAKGSEHYVLQIKGKAELTEDTATLASGGIANGDLVNVVLAQRGGLYGRP